MNKNQLIKLKKRGDKSKIELIEKCDQNRCECRVLFMCEVAVHLWTDGLRRKWKMKWMSIALFCLKMVSKSHKSGRCKKPSPAKRRRSDRWCECSTVEEPKGPAQPVLRGRRRSALMDDYDANKNHKNTSFDVSSEQALIRLKWKWWGRCGC